MIFRICFDAGAYRILFCVGNFINKTAFLIYTSKFEDLEVYIIMKAVFYSLVYHNVCPDCGVVIHPGLAGSVCRCDADVGSYEDIVEGAGADLAEGIVHDRIECAEFACVCGLKADLLKSCQLFLIEESFAQALAVYIVLGIEVAHYDAIFLRFTELYKLTDLLGTDDLVVPIEMEADQGDLLAADCCFAAEIPGVTPFEVALVFDGGHVLKLKF